MPRPLEFLRSVRLEMSQVKWPSHQETVRMTIMVIIVSAVVAGYAGGLDVVFTSLLQKLINP
ncbi:MAG TPA: preprotein translocase subunit SecE [Patescibacteria group bacterium]